MKRAFLYAAFVAAMSVAIIGGMTTAQQPKEPTPAELLAKQQAILDKQAAIIADLQKQLTQAGGQPGAPAIFKKFPRGAKLTPRHKLQAALPHRITKTAPTQFSVVPPQLSMWYNDTYGDCVTAQEAFSKACWSVQCGLPELFIPDAEVLRWSTKYGFRDGANLTDVMDQMKVDGFTVNGVNYKDGPYAGVDYGNETILQNAIFTGPVNVAIDANALPNGAGNNMGWYATGGSPGQYGNTDHCVALCGYGPAPFLFQQVGATCPPALTGKSGYLLFTWNTIGFVDHAWVMSTVAEAWVRSPTTPGQGPTPPPPPPPPPPGPPPGPPPTPTPGDIVVTIPAGTAPGAYTLGSGLSPDDMAVLQSIQDALSQILGTQTPEGLPPGWMRDREVAGTFGKSLEKAGRGDDFAKVQKHPLANQVMMRSLHRSLARDAEGQALLKQYQAGALPPGWLTNLLDWFIKNGPALIALIQTIMKLFGL